MKRKGLEWSSTIVKVVNCDICGQSVQCRGDETFALRNHANRSPYHKKCLEEIRLNELEKEREAKKTNVIFPDLDPSDEDGELDSGHEEYAVHEADDGIEDDGSSVGIGNIFAYAGGPQYLSDCESVSSEEWEQIKDDVLTSHCFEDVDIRD